MSRDMTLSNKDIPLFSVLTGLPSPFAGMVYYYFQESVGKTAPDHAIAGESSPVGTLLSPRAWGGVPGVVLLDLRWSTMCVCLCVCARALEKCPIFAKS